MSRSRFVGAVEIGTSQVTVLIGEVTAGRALHIIGFGEASSSGIIKGAAVDFRRASDAVHRAISDAERNARVHIDEVFLAQTGSHLDGFCNEATINVSAADNMVSQIDIDTVCGLAKGRKLPEGRVVVHHLPGPFRLDGRLTPDPEHLSGQRLEAQYWTVHGDERKIADHIHIIKGFNLPVTQLILSGLASGTVLTSAEDRQNGVLVIDIGAGATDYILYRHGCAHTAGVVAVGGSHVTNDLSLGLRVTEGQADKLKHLYGRSMVAARDRSDKVWLNGDFGIGDRAFPRQTIEQITSARMWELFEVVKKKIGEACAPGNLPAGIVLAGGASQMPATEEAAARVFGVNARLCELPGWVNENLRHPRFATVLGLLSYGGQSLTEEARSRRQRPGLGSFIKKLISV
ncbi:cell division protein FtsA [Opitutaceae bacterium TAV1]|nr:cell division protein FtsA [Opitutaceae bacterium TAV5]EIQ00073.1 cell division protein FtsA [Opitutaceae bacterium TAV1]